MILIKNGKLLTWSTQNYDKGCILIKEDKIIESAEHIEQTKGM